MKNGLLYIYFKIISFFVKSYYRTIKDSNINEVVSLWLLNESSAKIIYGHISDWNVSSVTNIVRRQ